jgi:hypothetical protein
VALETLEAEGCLCNVSGSVAGNTRGILDKDGACLESLSDALEGNRPRLAAKALASLASLSQPRLLLDSSQEDTVVALEHSEWLNIDLPLTTVSVGDTVKMPDSTPSDGLKGERMVADKLDRG